MKTGMLEMLKYMARSYPFIRSRVKEVERLYELDYVEMEEYKERRFLDIFRKAWSCSDFYRRIYSRAGIGEGDIRSLEDINKLPILTKEDIAGHQDEMLTVSPRWVKKSYTSGTSGKSFFVYDDYSTALMQQAYYYVFLQRCGFDRGRERLVSMRGVLSGRQFRMRNPLARTLFLSSYCLSRKSIRQYYEEIRAWNPKAIAGYPSTLYNLCHFLREEGLSLSIPLCFTSSETLFDFQRRLIAGTLNTSLFDWYGCTEKTIALVESLNHDGYYEAPGYSINEYRDDSVITTSLLNMSFPLIRYKVDDIIKLKTPFPLSTSHDVTVDAIEGRSDDNIVTGSGRVIGRLDRLFSGVGGIRVAQVVQHKPGAIDINIVPDANGTFDDAERKLLVDKVDRMIRLDDIDLSVNIVDENGIIHTDRNKFRQIVKPAEGGHHREGHS